MSTILDISINYNILFAHDRSFVIICGDVELSNYYDLQKSSTFQSKAITKRSHLGIRSARSKNSIAKNIRCGNCDRQSTNIACVILKTKI